jgi:hypothetical protein
MRRLLVGRAYARDPCWSPDAADRWRWLRHRIRRRDDLGLRPRGQRSWDSRLVAFAWS